MEALATASLQTSDAAVGRALGQAQACAGALGGANWEMFDAMREVKDHRQVAAVAVLNRLGEALTSDEHVVGLKSRLQELERDAMRLLTTAAPPVPPSPPPPPPPPPTPAPGPLVLTTPVGTAPEIIEEKQELRLSGDAAATALENLKSRLAEDHDLELMLSWRLQRKGTQL